MSLWLSEDEVVELTGYRQRSKQREALASLGVRFRSRPADGFLLVDRAQFEREPQGRRGKLDWDALRA